IEGSAGLYWKEEGESQRLVSQVTQGRLIGDMSVMLKERRPLDLVAMEDSIFLRIGATELMSVINSDAIVASSLLRSVSGNFMGVVGRMRDMRAYSSERGVDFTEFDAR
ncbi:MAG: cyclic nucleotide-binding domain-containing protein, partial [Granulosicoccus sp.]|nr:cyclic nucleotide-binding domain-containing protein [Granulosicoccus sp.]